MNKAFTKEVDVETDVLDEGIDDAVEAELPNGKNYVTPEASRRSKTNC